MFGEMFSRSIERQALGPWISWRASTRAGAHLPSPVALDTQMMMSKISRKMYAEEDCVQSSSPRFEQHHRPTVLPCGLKREAHDMQYSMQYSMQGASCLTHGTQSATHNGV